MREVARDFPDLSDPIFELFQAYLRATDIDYGDEEPPIDVQEIINILRNRLGESCSKRIRLATRVERWIFMALSFGGPISVGHRFVARI